MSKDEQEAKKEFIEEAKRQIGELTREGEKIASSVMQTLQQRIDFLRGIALGLFYGIVGNILVSHYYTVFEGLTLWKIDVLFWSNLMVMIVALVLIIFTSAIFYRRMRKYETGRRELSEVLDEFHELKFSRLEHDLKKKMKQALAKKKKLKMKPSKERKP